MLLVVAAPALWAQEEFPLWEGPAPFHKSNTLTLSRANREWLEETLFHRPMTSDERDRNSLVDQVTPATAPAFLAHAFDDELVPISESQDDSAALVAAGQKVEAHFFARGGHGFGPGRPEDGTGQWLELAAAWIRRQ